MAIKKKEMGSAAAAIKTTPNSTIAAPAQTNTVNIKPQQPAAAKTQPAACCSASDGKGTTACVTPMMKGRAITKDDIAKRAYEIWQRKGCRGSDVENWAEAERELKSSR